MTLIDLILAIIFILLIIAIGNDAGYIDGFHIHFN